MSNRGGGIPKVSTSEDYDDPNDRATALNPLAGLLGAQSMIHGSQPPPTNPEGSAAVSADASADRVPDDILVGPSRLSKAPTAPPPALVPAIEPSNVAPAQRQSPTIWIVAIVLVASALAFGAYAIVAVR